MNSFTHRKTDMSGKIRRRCLRLPGVGGEWRRLFSTKKVRKGEINHWVFIHKLILHAPCYSCHPPSMKTK